MEYRSEEIQTSFSGSVWAVSLGGRGAHGARPSEEERGDQITQGCNLVTADLPGNLGAASRLLTCHGDHSGFMQKKSCKRHGSSAKGRWSVCLSPGWAGSEAPARHWGSPSGQTRHGPCPPRLLGPRNINQMCTCVHTHTRTVGEGHRAGCPGFTLLLKPVI